MELCRNQNFHVLLLTGTLDLKSEQICTAYKMSVYIIIQSDAVINVVQCRLITNSWYACMFAAVNPSKVGVGLV